MGLVYCRECKASISGKALRCPKCGSAEPHTSYFACGDCGNRVASTEDCCPECGNPDFAKDEMQTAVVQAAKANSTAGGEVELRQSSVGSAATPLPAEITTEASNRGDKNPPQILSTQAVMRKDIEKQEVASSDFDLDERRIRPELVTALRDEMRNEAERKRKMYWHKKEELGQACGAIGGVLGALYGCYYWWFSRGDFYDPIVGGLMFGLLGYVVGYVCLNRIYLSIGLISFVVSFFLKPSLALWANVVVAGLLWPLYILLMLYIRLINPEVGEFLDALTNLGSPNGS